MLGWWQEPRGTRRSTEAGRGRGVGRLQVGSADSGRTSRVPACPASSRRPAPTQNAAPRRCRRACSPSSPSHQTLAKRPRNALESPCRLLNTTVSLPSSRHTRGSGRSRQRAVLPRVEERSGSSAPPTLGCTQRACLHTRELTFDPQTPAPLDPQPWLLARASSLRATASRLSQKSSAAVSPRAVPERSSPPS